MSSKAHLYEAIFHFNRGIEETVHSLGRLRKAQGFTGDIYRETLAKLEQARSQINLQFFADMKEPEKNDETRHTIRPVKLEDLEEFPR